MQEELHPIKRAFLAEYGHFADRRIKDLDKSDRFIIDDRDGGGPSFGADRTPYGWFCEMFADIKQPDIVQITIEGPLPTGDSVIVWLTQNSVKPNDRFGSGRSQYRFVVSPHNLDKLLSLADALNKLIANRNAKRDNSDWFTIPRIAACLGRVHRVLSVHWKTI